MTSVSCFQNEEVHGRLLGVCGSCTLSVCIVELIIFWMSLLCTSQTVLLLFLADLREIRITEMFESVNVSHSVTSYSLRPRGLRPSRLLCPWNSPGRNTGVGCLSLLRGPSPPRDRTLLFCIAGEFVRGSPKLNEAYEEPCINRQLFFEFKLKNEH